MLTTALANGPTHRTERRDLAHQPICPCRPVLVLAEGGAKVLKGGWRPTTGHSRLYVRRGTGQLGYIDLVARTIQVESDHERAQPNLEFIQMWFANPKPVKDRRSVAERATLKLAGLTDPAVVSVRTRDRGTDQLEVFLIDLGGRRRLGRVDLQAGIVDADDPAFEAVVAHAAVVARSPDPPRAN